MGVDAMANCITLWGNAGVLIVAFLTHASCSDRESPMDPVSSMREKICAARNPRDAARAFEVLFGHVGKDGIRALMWDKEDSIALQAAWRKIEASVTVGDSAFQLAEIQRFLGFTEGRFRCRIPSWWERALIGARIGKRQQVVYYAPTGAFKYRKAELAIVAPDNVEIKGEESLCRVKIGKKRVSVPIEIIEKASEIGHDHLTVYIGEKRAYIALHDYGGFCYRLMCIQVASDKVLWTAQVWGSGRRMLFGAGHHDVEIVEQGERVVVFGQESHGMYIEGFNVDNGCNLFRFRTCMPFPE
jgi:hypothetical protein